MIWQPSQGGSRAIVSAGDVHVDKLFTCTRLDTLSLHTEADVGAPHVTFFDVVLCHVRSLRAAINISRHTPLKIHITRSAYLPPTNSTTLGNPPSFAVDRSSSTLRGKRALKARCSRGVRTRRKNRVGSFLRTWARRGRRTMSVPMLRVDGKERGGISRCGRKNQDKCHCKDGSR